MVFFQCFFQCLYSWIRSDRLESRKKGEQEYCSCSFNCLLCAYACFELILLPFFLYIKNGNGYPSNFLKDLCENSNCPNVLTRMIATKVMTAMLLLLGAKWKSSVLKLPWFFVNITGFFPLWEILWSCICHFEHTKDAWEQADSLFKFIFN